MKEEKPEISIIIPIYNIEEYLNKCIESVVGQTFKNIEIILVDDGSSDESGEICDKLAKLDDRIKVIHKANGGQYSARKSGMRIAQGNYIGYVDGDDWIDSNMYETLLKYAKEYNVDVVESGMFDSWEKKERKRVNPIPSGCYIGADFEKFVEPYILYSGHFFNHGITPYLCSKLFKKNVVEQYQMIDDVASRIFDDWLVTYPCMIKTKSLFVTDECFYHYRVRNDSTKRKIRKNYMEEYCLLNQAIGNRFPYGVPCAGWNRQMEYYAMYRLLYKTPSIFEKKSTQNFFEAIPELKKDKKIIVYGAGAVGIHWYDFLEKNTEIVCWVDQNYEFLKDDLPVESPNVIKNTSYDYIVIAILREAAVKSVKNNLISMGVNEEKILWISQKYIDNPNELLKII